MRRKIAIWGIVIVSLSGCNYIISNFPRAFSSIILDNDIKITLELNENIMAMRDAIVDKKITIDYGKRQLVHRSHYDDYDYRIYLIKEKQDTIWVLTEEDGYSKATCSFSDPKAKFRPVYGKMNGAVDRDTLISIDYTDFVFTVK